jgi:predicted ATPase/DNA-binding SARP family transcriptional activator
VATLLVKGLGPLEVLWDGAPVSLGGHKQRVVLALLALRANAVVAVDTLVEAVWGQRPPGRPESVLQVYVANLRRALEPDRKAGARHRIVSGAGGYRLALSSAESDHLTFDELLVEAGTCLSSGDLPAAAEVLRTGVDLWRGPAYPDLIEVGLAQAELTALEERRLAATEDLLDLRLSIGQHSRVAAEAAELVATHPFRERLRAAHIAALYRAQRQGEALEACRAARDFLAEELGVEPGPALLELEHAILIQDPALQRSPGTTNRRQRISNLPAALSSFIGRDTELDDLDELLSRGAVRLVTLVGPGGTGKTRLAMAAAARTERFFDDGACWVALDSVSADNRVLDAVAAALGVPGNASAGLLAATTAFLRPRHLLLVLDNFEQVLGAWPLITDLLDAAPRLQVLVTSRVALHLSGEQRFDVPQLGLPPQRAPITARCIGASEAVQLFVARAALVDRRFRLDDGNAGSIASLCHRLDGLPLAIELAAGHISQHCPAALLKTLSEQLGALGHGPRDVSDRQRTLRGCIEWSYRLLDAPAKHLFAALGVFAGSCDVEAIAAVADAGDEPVIEPLLGVLVAHSLTREQPRRDETTTSRFTMLQTVRSYALDVLATQGGESAARRRHAEYYADVAERIGGLLHGPEQAAGVARLDVEEAELDAAVAWAAGEQGDDGDLHLLLRLVGALWQYWQLSGHITFPLRHVEAALCRADTVDPALRAPALSGAGTLSWRSGHLEASRDYHRRALEDYRRIGDERGIAWSTMCLATQDVVAGDLDSAWMQATTALSLAQGMGNARIVAATQTLLGGIAFYQDDVARAERLQLESLATARAAADPWPAGIALINLSNVTESTGEYDRAMGYVREALQIGRATGDRTVALYGIEAVGELLLRLGAPRRAARLLAAADRYRIDYAQPLDDHERGLKDQIIEETRAAVGEVAFAVAWSEGATYTLEEAVSDALASSRLSQSDSATV